MPDFAVASSNRMVLGALVCGACANKEEDRRRSPRNRWSTLVSSLRVAGRGAGHVGRRWRLQQDHGNGIFRRGFRAGVASPTAALLAAAHPEESRFVLQSLASAIQQFDL